MSASGDVPNSIDVLHGWAKSRPDTVAMAFRQQERTWVDLLDRVRRLATVLTDAGVGPGDRVAFLDRNHSAAIEVALAGAWIGAVTVPVNYRLAPPEIAYVLQDADTKLLVLGSDFAPVVASLGRCPALPLEAEYEARLSAAAPAEHPVSAAPDDCFLQLYTSGTTGFPKGAMLTHRNLAAHSAALGARVGLTRDSITLAPMPLYHVGGMSWSLLALHRGARLLLVRDVVPSELIEIIKKQAVTHCFVVPTVLAGMLQVEGLAHRHLSSLRGLTYGAAPMPLPLLRRVLEEIDADVFQVYGMTEMSGVATTLGPADHRAPLTEEHLHSAGRPLDGVDLTIVDPETLERAPVRTVGEILLHGDQVMAGYWHHPEATAAAVLPDGSLRTGDAGYLDEHGHLFIVDRIKDVIISGGENIYPAELERVLLEHPDVADVAVIGVSDEKWGEVPEAIIVESRGARPDPAALLAFCRARLASYKLPKYIQFTAELPRNAAGKVLKQKLRGQVHSISRSAQATTARAPATSADRSTRMTEA